MRFPLRKKFLGLLFAGAWLPAVVTCSLPRVFDVWGPPVVVDEYVYVEVYEEEVIVEEGPYVDGWGFDFLYW